MASVGLRGRVRGIVAGVRLVAAKLATELGSQTAKALGLDVPATLVSLATT